VALTVTARGTGTHNTGATSLVPGGRTATLAVGSMGVLCIALDNAGSGGATTAAPSSWTDAKGNVWTRRQNALYDNGAASAGIEFAIYTAPITTALLTSDAGTMTWDASASVTAKAWTWYEVIPSAGGTVVYSTGGNIAGATAANASVTTASVPVGDAVIAGYFAENVNAVTGDSDTTNGTWQAQQTATVGSGTSGVRIATQSKVQTTAASTQSYDVTVASQDRIAGYVLIGEVFAKVGSDTGSGGDSSTAPTVSYSWGPWSATWSNAVGSTTVNGSDTGTGADSTSARGISAVNEPMTGADSTAARGISTADTATGADSGAAGTSGEDKLASDSATAVDAHRALGVRGTDTAAGGDASSTIEWGTFSPTWSNPVSGATPKTGSDTGTGVESLSIVASSGFDDVGAAAEAVSGRAIVVPEAGAGSDVSSARAITGSDTGAGTDTGAASNTLSGTDSGSTTDAVAARTITPVESGTGSDTGTPGASYTAADASTGADASTARGIAVVESGASTETAGPGYIVTDTGTAVDTSSAPAATLTGADAGTSIEAVTLRGIAGADTATGVDTSALDAGGVFTRSDSGSSTDVVSGLGISLADSGASADVVTIREIRASEVGTGGDASVGGSDNGVTAADTGTGSDASSTTAAASSTEAVIGLDAVSVRGILAVEAGSSTDTAEAGAAHVRSEAAGSTETASVSNLVLGVDSGTETAVAAVVAALTGFDDGTWTEDGTAIPPFFPFGPNLRGKVTQRTLSATVTQSPTPVRVGGLSGRVRD
jgi:hypothetical protein